MGITTSDLSGRPDVARWKGHVFETLTPTVLEYFDDTRKILTCGGTPRQTECARNPCRSHQHRFWERGRWEHLPPETCTTSTVRARASQSRQRPSFPNTPMRTSPFSPARGLCPSTAMFLDVTLPRVAPDAGKQKRFYGCRQQFDFNARGTCNLAKNIDL
jgi:hypothetical protein